MSEKLHYCKACGKEVAKSAKSCPHCGAKNKKGHPILIGALVFIVLIVLISSSGGSDEPQKVTDAPPAQTQDTGTTQTPPKTEETVFTVGDTVELAGVKVCLEDVSVSKGSQYNKPTSGNVFAICEFTIENNSDEEITVSSMMSFEAYCDEFACNYSLSALLAKDNKNQLDGTVAPGKKLNGIIGYEVPKDWKELEVHFTPDVWDDKNIVFVAANN